MPRHLRASLSAATVLTAVVAGGLLGVQTRAQAPVSFDPALFSELHWRNIGPFRGGRTKAASGIAAQPGVFYIGAVNGGVWNTNDYGRTWTPIFDSQPTGSIGAIAIAPSDPRVIYVGSGEGLQRPDLSTGDGVYKSTDGGTTWTHLGLRDGQQIPQIVVDPRNPDRLFVAVLGHPYGPNEERGIFRSTDGGRTFQRVLYKDQDTGAADVVLDPSSGDIVYAVLWQARQGPWENGVFTGPGSGVFKSTDGGTTWRPIVNGLPTFQADGLGRIGITVAPSLPSRLFATVQAAHHGGLYRSDDGGESWSLVNADPRVTERGDDFAEVKVDPKNPDVVYTASVVAWKSTDGGRTFTGWRGAPGGDDYHRLWINPNDPDIILLAGDQGAIVTVNGGATWSSWYNQPTAQFYHVSTDNAFPYRVCGGQQESGSACVASRGGWGEITVRDWTPVGAEEYGYIAPDPMDPDTVYGGKLTKYDRRSGEVQDITPPRGPNYRVLRTAPVLFSPTERGLLFFAANTLWKTTNGGMTWAQISPDLSRETWEVPANVGIYKTTPAAQPTRRGVIYTIAPSTIDNRILWAGTDDGLIHVTHDSGTTWTNVTPAALTPWAKVSMIEASHFDVNSAYAAVNTFRLDDLRPHILRTRDSGRTWTEITTGLPAGGVVNTVHEDSARRGLLFAGSEQAVYVSFDDGQSWQSLRLNMPATSIRDLVIKDDDLVIGTHGRGFWILDDIAPLRQITADVAKAAAFLFRPGTAYRVRDNVNTDTPLPPDEPTAPNPPDGVTLSYLLGAEVTGPVSLDIVENASGELIRHFSSDDPVETPIAGRNIPDYWLRPSSRLSSVPGLHRFVWDLRYAPPLVDDFEYPMTAVPHRTPQEPRGMLVLPGVYQARLTAGPRVYRQPVIIKIDPRVKASMADLTHQLDLSKSVDTAIRDTAHARQDIRARLATAAAEASGRLRTVGDELDRAAAPLKNLFETLQAVDARPTAAVEAAVTAALERANAALAAYRSLQLS
ncbi:MAG TPA: hypothetical protein VLT86_17780 [Vicinamibacterales bacterium]|nr:hypothetical protein [Vicinamibacterales bacterium]